MVKKKWVNITSSQVIDACAALEELCIESWRNGHTVTVKLGNTKLTFPRLKRSTQLYRLFSYYQLWCQRHDCQALGHENFNFLAKKITVLNKGNSGLGSYYVDGVCQNFPFLDIIFLFFITAFHSIFLAILHLTF